MNGSEVLNMASTIQVRAEDELKSKSDVLFKDLGTDTTTAIRMFLTQAVATNFCLTDILCFTVLKRILYMWIIFFMNCKITKIK